MYDFLGGGGGVGLDFEYKPLNICKKGKIVKSASATYKKNYNLQFQRISTFLLNKTKCLCTRISTFSGHVSKCLFAITY